MKEQTRRIEWNNSKNFSISFTFYLFLQLFNTFKQNWKCFWFRFLWFRTPSPCSRSRKYTWITLNWWTLLKFTAGHFLWKTECIAFFSNKHIFRIVRGCEEILSVTYRAAEKKNYYKFIYRNTLKNTVTLWSMEENRLKCVLMKIQNL